MGSRARRNHGGSSGSLKPGEDREAETLVIEHQESATSQHFSPKEPVDKIEIKGTIYGNALQRVTSYHQLYVYSYCSQENGRIKDDVTYGSPVEKYPTQKYHVKDPEDY